jgi:hypothetical protein
MSVCNLPKIKYARLRRSLIRDPKLHKTLSFYEVTYREFIIRIFAVYIEDAKFVYDP